VGIVVLPILVYLIVNQALGAAVFQAWTFNIAYLDDTANRLENIKHNRCIESLFHRAVSDGVYSSPYLSLAEAGKQTRNDPCFADR